MGDTSSRIKRNEADSLFFIWLQCNRSVAATAEKTGYSRKTISNLVNNGLKSQDIMAFKDRVSFFKDAHLVLLESDGIPRPPKEWNLSYLEALRELLWTAHIIRIKILKWLKDWNPTAITHAKEGLEMIHRLEQRYMDDARRFGLVDERVDDTPQPSGETKELLDRLSKSTEEKKDVE